MVINMTEARLLAMAECIKTNAPSIVEACNINIMVFKDPIDGLKMVKGLINLSDYVDTEGQLPYIKESVAPEHAEFINAQLTNEINRKLKNRVGDDINITDYKEDRASLIEAARSNVKYLNFVKSIKFNNRIPTTNGLTMGVLARLKELNIENYIGYPVLLRVMCVPSKYVLHSDELDSGKCMRIPEKGSLIVAIDDSNLVFNDTYEVILYTDKGEQYIIDKSVYGYNTIRKFTMNELSEIDIQL